MNTKEALRKRIIEISRKKFAKIGFSYVRTNDIANDLGISKRTLYEIFPSKEAIFDEILSDVLNHIKTKIEYLLLELDKKEAKSFISILKSIWDLDADIHSEFSDEFFLDMRRNLPLQWERLMKFRDDQYINSFDKIYNYGVKNNYIKKEIDKDIFYYIYYYSTVNILNPDIISQLSCSLYEACGKIYDVLLTGSLTDKGNKEYHEVVNKPKFVPKSKYEVE